MTDWPTACLGDHIRIKHGFAFQGDFFDESGEYIVLTPGNFIESGGFKPKSGAEKYYTASPPDEFVLRSGDLVIAMTEQAHGLLGSSALIPNDNTYLHNQRIGLVEQVSKEIDRQFLYYLFNTSGVRDQIQATATGSKVRHTAPRRVESVTVQLPPLPTQRKIAAILSAYDDLIANNSRRITLLEEAARRIYREWFVNFRYPGHADTPLVSSVVGQIPARWTVGPLSSLTGAVTRGISPRYADASAQVVINQRCIRGGALDLTLARPHATAVPSAKVVRIGDILINSTGVGTLGRVAQVLMTPVSLTVDSHVTIVRPALEAADPTFLGMALRERESDLAALGVGSTGQTELGRRAIGEIRIVVPPLSLQREFSDAVGPLRLLSTGLAAGISTLRSIRDTLLPRLVSGEIDVTDLNVTMPEVAA